MKLAFVLAIFIFILFCCITFASPVEITIDYGNITCTENWNCPDWSTIQCVNNVQTRTCTDQNGCGTTINKSAETQPCSSGNPVNNPGGLGGLPSPGGTSSSPVKSGNKNVSTQPQKTIPPTPQLKQSDSVTLELSCVDEIESGEPLSVSVTISSKNAISTTVELLDEKQDVSLQAGETKTLDFEVYAPETEGYYNIVAVTSYATGNKTIFLDYKPLFLYVTPIDNQTYEVHIKNFDNTSTTELQVVKDKVQTVYLDTMNGKIDYKVNLTFVNPGSYMVEAKAMSGFSLLDDDVRTINIEGKPEINYGLLIVLVILIVILIGSILIFKELRR